MSESPIQIKEGRPRATGGFPRTPSPDYLVYRQKVDLPGTNGHLDVTAENLPRGPVRTIRFNQPKAEKSAPKA